MDSLDAEHVEWITNMHENRIESPEAHMNMVWRWYVRPPKVSGQVSLRIWGKRQSKDLICPAPIPWCRRLWTKHRKAEKNGYWINFFERLTTTWAPDGRQNTSDFGSIKTFKVLTVGNNLKLSWTAPNRGVHALPLPCCLTDPRMKHKDTKQDWLRSESMGCSVTLLSTDTSVVLTCRSLRHHLPHKSSLVTAIPCQ